jgi:serine/threonine protein kinase
VKVVNLVLLRQSFTEYTGHEISFDTLHENILREVNVLSSLHHENIVTLIDSFTIDRKVYLFMELIEGQDLLNAIPNGGFSEDVAKELFFQILSAVSYLRLSNIIHGDLKPDNILLRSDGRIKIIDFGFSQIVRPGEKTEVIPSKTLFFWKKIFYLFL